MGFQWNYGDILDAIDAAVPATRLALAHGDREITWGEFRHRSNNLARALLAGGAQPGDKIGFYMRNCP
ncbi:MAG: AMP-binding protein, partial [Pseudomonadales bacterium]